MSDGMLDKYARDYAAGTVLFHEGDDGREMYVIQSGEVEIYRRVKGQNRTLAVLPPGEFFGEMSIVNNRPRSATAVVRRQSRLLVIDEHKFEAMIRSKAEIAVRMIKTLSARLERANQQIELLLLKDVNHRVVHCLRHLADEQGADDETAVYIPISLDALAARVAQTEDQVSDVLQRLASARLVLHASEAGIDTPGYVIPEVGRLLEFLEFLELRDRFGTL